MASPINYLGGLPQAQPDLGGSFQQGLQIASGIQSMKARRDQNELQKQMFEQKLGQEQVAQERKLQFRNDYGAYMKGEMGLKDLQANYPDQFKMIKDSVAFNQEIDNKAEAKKVGELYSAVQTNPEYAVSILEKRKLKALDDGDQAEFNRLDVQQELIKEGKTDVLTRDLDFKLDMLGTDMSDKFKTRSEATKLGEEATTEREGRDSVIAEREEKTLNLKEERKKLIAETRRISQNGGMEPKEKSDMEMKYRNQYLKEGGEDYAELQRHHDNIVNADLTGVGGLTTVLSYMKMVDPTSVVSSSEQATAKNAPGWTEGMRNTWNKMFSEGEVSETTAKQFKNQAAKMLASAKKRADKARKTLESAAKHYKLNTGFIFNEEEQGKGDQIDTPAWYQSGGTPGYFGKY